MSISPYINFQGQAKEAMEFYAKVLNTSPPDMMLYGDMPADPNFPVTEENKNWVMHGAIKIDDQLIMFSDVIPGSPLGYKHGNNISILIDNDNLDELKAIFNAFSDGATITMPFEKTFWAKGFGSLTDKFGIDWQFNCSPSEE